jgi:uncharacterized protein (DUF488 family)
MQTSRTDRLPTGSHSGGNGVKVYSIGFTKKTAAEFFTTLRQAELRRLLDVRLHNSSHLAGFSKRDDLAFFLKELCGAEYLHEPLLTPTPDLLEGYRKKRLSWQEYEPRFRSLLAERAVEKEIARELFQLPTVLLCSEVTATRCHRRLILEYLQEKWGGLEIVHL